MGRAQLSRLDAMIERRHQIRLRYRDLFAAVPGVSLFGEPWVSDDGQTRDNFWLTSIVVDPGQAGFTSEELRVALAEQNIESRPLWKPMHLQPVFAGAPAVVDGTAERMFRTGLSLPSSSALTDAQLDRVMGAILAFVRGDRGRD